MIWAARIGYAARGTVYLLIAYSAALGAIGWGDTQDSHEALSALAEEFHGRVLLYAIIAGLGLFSVWRVLQSVGDIDRHGFKPQGVAIRLALTASAVIHGSLALWAFKMASGTPQDAISAAQWTARVLAHPGGRWWVGVGALVLAGIGAAHVFKAVRRRFLRYLSSGARQPWIIAISQTGLVARGIVFAGFAGFAIRAGWHRDPDQTKDLSGLLHWLQDFPHGSIWIAAAAVGLAAFGAYSLLQAWYRLPTPPAARAPSAGISTADVR